MTKTVMSALATVQSEQLFNTLQQNRPLIKQLITQHGSTNLVEYIANYYRAGLHPPQADRQSEFLQTFSDYAKRQFDEPIVEQAVAQLRSYYTVSTADHHTPLFPSHAFQANALTAAAYRAINDNRLSMIIVLGCSSVSLNHLDFPRGFSYHTVVGDEIVTERMAIFSSRQQMHPVYEQPAYTTQQLAVTVKQLKTRISHGRLKAVPGERLLQIITEYYNDPVVLSAQRYTGQVSRLNQKLWRALWGPEQPDLMYLDEEGLVAQLILDHHITQTTVIHALLFDEAVRAQLLPQLVQAMGAHLSQQGTGTELFWALSPTNHHRVPLHINQQTLVSSNATRPIHIPLTPDHIQAALLTKQIFPNLMLCYTVLSLYYQLNCLGGFNQMSYLTAMQAVYGASHYDLAFRPATTTTMHYGLSSAFAAHGQSAVTLTGMDLWLSGQPDFLQAWKEAMHQVTVRQSLQWLAPALYRYLPPAEQAIYNESALTKYRVIDSIERSSNQSAILSINN